MMKYNKLTTEDIKFIKDIFGPENIFVGSDIKKEFTHDELTTVFAYPEIHVLASNKNQIAKVMKYANEKLIPVTVRGTGTGLVGACVPLFGGILIDMTKMNKIIELDKTNLTLTVEGGVMLMDIYEFINKENLYYAPDPGEKSATIGGNIATNAGGMRAIKYGVTRDWIRGLEVVLPNGEIAKFGGKVVKNSTGYSLKDLIVGSEGTLGIVVEATLKLIPKPLNVISLLVPFNSMEEAIKTAPEMLVRHVIPTALEFFEKESLSFSETFLGKKIPHNNYPAYLLLSYDGSNKEALENDVEVASSLLVNEFGAIDVYLIDTEDRRKGVWSVRDGFLESIKASTTLMDECDVVLPRSEINDFLKYVEKLSKDLEIRIPYFGHVGDGNLHIYFCKDDLDQKTWEGKLSKGFDALYDMAAKRGGLVSGEHGIGYAKKEYLKKQLGQTQLQIMKGIKNSFDPNNILNPGKVID